MYLQLSVLQRCFLSSFLYFFSKKNMEVKNGFCCSCFIDQAIWFVHNSDFSWQFDTLIYKNGAISDEIFIYDKHYEIINENFIYYRSRIVICCLDCIKFTLHLLSHDLSFHILLNDVNCDYVFHDYFSFDDDDMIYYGNGLSGANDPQNHISTDEILKKYIEKYPKKKCCFTSLGNFYYKYFCTSCSKIFMETVIKNFYHLKNGYNRRRK